MIGIDTNMVVRFLVNDDPKQSSLVAHLLEKNPVFISKTVLLETEWVLRYTYELSSEVIQESFIKFLGLANVNIEDPTSTTQALNWYEKKMDFADALHLASCHHINKFATFDKKLIKHARKLNVEIIDPAS